jgi:AcrR family transcriptional regulator
LILIGRRGVRRLGMRELAEAAGVSRGTLYRYFPSKEHVLAAAAAFDGQRFTNGLDAALAVERGPARRISAFMSYSFEFIRTHPCRPLFESEPGFVMSYLLDNLPALRDELVRHLGDAFDAVPAVAAGTLGKDELADVIARLFACPAAPRDLLVQRRCRRPQEQAAHDPPADRPAGAQEVPQAARPDLRPAQDGGHGGEVRTSSTTSSTASSSGARSTSPRSSPSRSPPRSSSRCSACPSRSSTRFLTMKDGIIRPEHVTGTKFGSEGHAYQQKIADSVYEYFNEILDEREKEPKDDLLSHFLERRGRRAQADPRGHPRHLLPLPHRRARHRDRHLDCMFAFLAQHPEHRRQLVETRAVIPSAIEELLRWETPVMMVARVAVEDTELAGCPVHKGDTPWSCIGSANTDEAEFPDADEVRFDREVNRHIAFGGGVHRCLGSHLARLELRVALREWHQAHPRVLGGARSRARLHDGHPLHRLLPDALHGVSAVSSATS